MTIGPALRIKTDSETHTLRSWVPLPSQSGRYLVELKLEKTPFEVIGSVQSNSFHVIGKRCCRTYETPSYIARIPRGWHLREDYAPASAHRYVSRAMGPGNMELLIDTTLNDHGNPIDDQRELESLLAQGTERYRRLDIRQLEVDGRSLVEWSYQSGRDLYANELFYRGENGYAILGTSSSDHFREIRDVCRRVARLLQDRPPTSSG